MRSRDQLEDSVKEDVRWLRNHPLLQEVDEINGAIYDLVTGTVSKVDV